MCAERMLEMWEVVVATLRSAEFSDWILTQKVRERQGIQDVVNVVSHQGAGTYHAKATELVKVLSPVYALLRCMDSDKGNMGSLYNTWAKVSCVSLQLCFVLIERWCSEMVRVVIVLSGNIIDSPACLI
jgi:hypothetical protein